MEDIKCPKCASTNIHVDKKGFSTGKAVAGTLIGNPVVGALAGTHGSNKIIMTCLNCGHEFKPGEQLRSRPIEEKLPDGVHVNKNDYSDSYGIDCSYCGKSAYTSMSACPKCGRRFTSEEKKAAIERAIDLRNNPPKKKGCFGFIVLFVVLGGLLSILMS